MLFRGLAAATTPGAVATVTALLLLAGCGDGDSAAKPTSSPGLFGADVTAARPGATPRDLVVTLDVPAGHRACASEPAATVEQSDRYVWVQTTIMSVAGEYGVCPERAPMEFRVAIPPLGERELVINQQAWELSGDGTYAHCSEVLGCDPPEDRCDRAWVNALLAGSELPPERDVDVLACDGRWLVLDVDAVVTGCQSIDGAPPPTGCAGSGVHRRWFAMLDDQRFWEVVASGTAGGCGEVHAQVPDFPARLCEDLPSR